MMFAFFVLIVYFFDFCSFSWSRGGKPAARGPHATRLSFKCVPRAHTAHVMRPAGIYKNTQTYRELSRGHFCLHYINGCRGK